MYDYYHAVFSDVETVRTAVSVPASLPCLPYVKPMSTKKETEVSFLVLPIYQLILYFKSVFSWDNRKITSVVPFNLDLTCTV